MRRDADRERVPRTQAVTSRRNVVTAAVLTPVLAGVGAGTARAAGRSGTGRHGTLVEPAPTAPEDWQDIAEALRSPGAMNGDLAYHTGFPRHDLRVVCRGVRLRPDLALGSHITFVRYVDGSAMVMGDLTLTERELQPVTDTLYEHRVTQTSIHKHLLGHSPDVWWTHIHAHGTDPVAMARGLRAALDRTGTPPAAPPAYGTDLDLDMASIDAVLGVQGAPFDGVYKSLFFRREIMSDSGMRLPRGLASTSAFSFQPLGGGRAALHGDFAMIGSEVYEVMSRLRRGGIEIATLHNHGLTDDPRLFFIHVWSIGDAVEIAKALRPAVDVTNVEPSRGLTESAGAPLG